MGKQHNTRHVDEGQIPGLEAAFGEVLRRHRQRIGLTQEMFADKLGLDRTYISYIERGLRRPSLGAVFTFAHAFGVSASQLLKEVEDSIT